MKFNSFKFLLSFICVALFSSCFDSDEPTEYSSDATFVSLKLANSDALAAGVFTLVGDTILNVDSLAYGTELDSVKVAFKFTSSYLVRVISNNDTTFLTGTDTLNLTKKPIEIKNIAANRVDYEIYYLKINVHKVIPELYVWKNIGENIVTDNVKFQKTVMLNNKMYYFYNTGVDAYLSTSTNGIDWTASQSVNCPVATTLNDLCVFNGKFYVTQDDNSISSSTDGITWTKTVKSGYIFKSLLFIFDNKLWSVVKNDGAGYQFANSTNGIDWVIQSTTFPDNFPVSGATTLSFLSRTGKPKVLVVGGYNAAGNYKNTNFSSEDCNYWVDYSSELSGRVNALDSLAPGASIIKYDKKLFLFGAVKKGEVMTRSYFRRSIDEGYSWQVADSITNIQYSVTNKIPDSSKAGAEKDTTYYVPMSFRTMQSVVVDNSNNIFVVGGKNNTAFVKEVWTGKLNRLNFLIQ